MNSDELLNAFGSVDPDLVNRVSCYSSSIKPGRIVSVALCLCGVFAVLLIVGNKPQDNVLPFTLMAYAEDENGTLVAGDLTLENDVPVSKRYSEDRDCYYFYFSYDNTITNERWSVRYYNDPAMNHPVIREFFGSDIYSYRYIAGMSAEEQRLAGVYFGKTNAIYYFIPEESERYPFTFYSYPDEDVYRYVIDGVIYYKDGSYYAHLNSIRKEAFEGVKYKIEVEFCRK